MAGPEFFQTVMGRQFYDGTMTSIARSLEKLANPVLSTGGLIGRKATFTSDDNEAASGIILHAVFNHSDNKFYLLIEDLDSGELYSRPNTDICLAK